MIIAIGIQRGMFVFEVLDKYILMIITTIGEGIESSNDGYSTAKVSILNGWKKLLCIIVLATQVDIIVIAFRKERSHHVKTPNGLNIILRV